MKVLGINGSPRKDGNTAILIRTVFSELNQQGIDTELIQFSDVTVKGCVACGGCATHMRCVVTDDDFNECFEKMLAADGIILGSPVYSADVTSQIKALIDRAAIISGVNRDRGLFKHKVGAAVVAARRGGAMGAVDTLHHFLHSKEMFLVGSTYWNMVYGRNIGEVEQDQEGIANMKNLGQNMAWLLNKIHG